MLLSQNEAWKKTDALAIAPYMTLIPAPASETLSSDSVAGWTMDEILDYTATNALPECMGWVEVQKEVADKYGLELICYEAGQHLVGSGGGENNPVLTDKLIAANRDARMGVIYGQYLDGWRAAGGGLMALFSSVSVPGKWGSWGLLEYDGQLVAPKYDAVMEWNAENARTRPGLRVILPGEGVMTLELIGDPLEFYRLEISADLSRWEPYTNLSTDGASVVRLDAGGWGRRSARYYRAWSP
jgi:hypothetical protein